MNILPRFLPFTLFVAALIFPPAPHGAELPQTIAQLKPAIVGVGTFEKTRSPPVNFMGTGFAVGDGHHVVTNAHVIPAAIDSEKKESVIILTNQGNATMGRNAQVVALDKEHDLALLKIGGEALPTIKLGDSSTVREGQSLFFTGFPIGMVLGLHPVTHRGMVSAITPVVMPGLNTQRLDAKMIARLRNSLYDVFQLDGAAYPGNSGSPLYDPENGLVYGIINMVFVKGTKENALSQPSGITYAIPGNHIRALLRQERLIE
ncbi:MAG: serine protease [Sulfuricella sp.]|nr:serine protease [Sulfuricella sp.]